MTNDEADELRSALAEHDGKQRDVDVLKSLLRNMMEGRILLVWYHQHSSAHPDESQRCIHPQWFEELFRGAVQQALVKLERTRPRRKIAVTL